MSKISALFAAMDISSTGLSSQRRRMNTIAENLANTTTTNTVEGGPYKRKITRFNELYKNTSMTGDNGKKLSISSSRAGHLSRSSDPTFSTRFSGVDVETFQSNAEPDRVFDPDHPDADAQGYVRMPKISIVSEMVDMISASRAYEANVTSIKVAKDMARKALEI